MLSRAGVVASSKIPEMDANPFDPSQARGYMAHFAARDLSTSALTGNEVTTWGDISGNGYHAVKHSATGATANTRTINGVASLDFTNNRYTIPADLRALIVNQEVTIYAVGQLDATSNNIYPFLLGRVSPNTRFNLGILGATGVAVAQCDAAGGTSSMSITPNTSPVVMSMVRQGAVIEVIYNGVKGAQDFGADNVALTDLYIGGRPDGSLGFQWDGHISEIIICNRKHTDAEINQINASLAATYGLSIPEVGASPQSFVPFGDSVTEGSAATTPANRYANIVAAHFGGYFLNRGVSGSVLQNTPSSITSNPLANNGRDRYVAALLGNSKCDKVVIAYGINDINKFSQGMTVANFENDLGEVVAGLISGGYLPQNIILCTPGFMVNYDGDPNGPARHLAYNQAVQNVATLYGTKCADVYTAMLNNGGASLLNDDVHPNNGGHAVEAAAIIAAA